GEGFSQTRGTGFARGSGSAPSSLIIQRFPAKPPGENGGGRASVNFATILSFIPLAVGLFAAQPTAMQQTVTRLVIQDEVILRVPVQPRPFGPPIDWVEKKAPNCVPVAVVRGALLSGPNQVDFILAGGGRIRAKFDEDCPGLDFYQGFY